MVKEVEEWCGGRYVLVEIMPTLPGRGEGSFTKCVRMSPERDLTNGFFVACFRRTSACGSKRPKSTHVVAHSDNRGDIQRDNSCDIQGEESAGGHRNVPKKRRASNIPVNPSATKKRKMKRKRKRNGKSVTAEA